TVQTPDQLHHSMETHGSVAEWLGDSLTLWDSTQHIFGVRRQVAAALGIPLDRVRVLSPFSGGGFGSKNGAGKYSVIAALAARRDTWRRPSRSSARWRRWRTGSVSIPWRCGCATTPRTIRSWSVRTRASSSGRPTGSAPGPSDGSAGRPRPRRSCAMGRAGG